MKIERCGWLPKVQPPNFVSFRNETLWLAENNQPRISHRATKRPGWQKKNPTPRILVFPTKRCGWSEINPIAQYPRYLRCCHGDQLRDPYPRDVTAPLERSSRKRKMKLFPQDHDNGSRICCPYGKFINYISSTGCFSVGFTLDTNWQQCFSSHPYGFNAKK